LLQLQKDITAANSSCRQVGIERKRTVETGKGRLMISEHTEHKSADKPWFGQIGLQRGCSIVGSERIAVLVQ
jgi:hypothetical protein